LSRRIPTPATAVRQPPPPAESRRTAGSSRPATGVSLPAVASPRDGSRFPFDQFSGTMRM
jgi:hypothetical protein